VHDCDLFRRSLPTKIPTVPQNDPSGWESEMRKVLQSDRPSGHLVHSRSISKRRRRELGRIAELGTLNLLTLNSDHADDSAHSAEPSYVKLT
jgi:hypothetical protein